MTGWDDQAKKRRSKRSRITLFEEDTKTYPSRKRNPPKYFSKEFGYQGFTVDELTDLKDLCRGSALQHNKVRYFDENHEFSRKISQYLYKIIGHPSYSKLSLKQVIVALKPNMKPKLKNCNSQVSILYKKDTDKMYF